MSNYTENFTSINGSTTDATELEAEFDAIATAIATKLDSDGSGAMTGDLNMGSNNIENLSDPVSANDAVNFSALAIRQIAVGTSSTDSANGTTSISNTSLSVSITPNYSDSRILVWANAYVSAENVSAGSAAPRYGNWQIYRSSGAASVIASASVGRQLDANSSAAANDFARLSMLCTEVPGAGTHDYVLRYSSPLAGVQAQFNGTSGAVMVALEVKP